MLRPAMGRPWRQTEGLLRSIVQLLGLDVPVLDDTTLARRSARLPLTTALKTLTRPVDVVIVHRLLRADGVWHRRMAAGEARWQTTPQLASGARGRRSGER
ncbi:hypothetical protein M2351_006205 [Azospirillum canadense]|nr:hypothetical protein [Azospirillum canadense]